MTNKEAIEYGKKWDRAIESRGDTLFSEARQFLNLAIKALEERPQGEWIPMNPDCRGYSDYFKCSICGAYIYPNIPEKELDYNGCPYCSADMRKGGAK